MFIDFNKIDARILELKDDLIRDIQKWVSIPSTGGLHIYTYEKLFK